MAKDKTELELLFLSNFTCKICSQILHDPVQCQSNEHYFCRTCITSSLRNSKRCPDCMDHLTIETLRPPSRIVANVVSKLKKPRCRHASRGCTENIEVEDVFLHEQTCGYAPVVCPNEGCNYTVNRRDQESHKTKQCKFRKITCESCHEEMVYSLYETHVCAVRKEMDKVKSRLSKVTEVLNEISKTQAKLQERLDVVEKSVVASSEKPMPEPISTIISKESTTTPKMKGQILIIGKSDGYRNTAKSLEVFDWSKMTWTLYQDCLHFPRVSSIVFLEGSRIMIYGGQGSRKLECLNPSETGFTSTILSSSSDKYEFWNDYNGVRCGNRIITFYRNVVETKLEPPYKSKTLLYESYTRLVCSVVRLGDSIYIIGGQPSTMEHYDVVKNKMTLLDPVPYPVDRMACVAYGDNIIIIGGEDDYRRPLDDVVMYNVTTKEYKMLPSMLEKRAGCAAVIMGHTIVVMGGGRRNRKKDIYAKKSAEYLVIGESKWHELPEMNIARAFASAVVYE